MTRGIEVAEHLELVTEAMAIRHSEGCLLLLGGKPILVDEQTAIQLAWDLCVMFQESRFHSDGEAALHVENSAQRTM